LGRPLLRVCDCGCSRSLAASLPTYARQQKAHEMAAVNVDGKPAAGCGRRAVLMEVLPLWDVAPPFDGAPPVLSSAIRDGPHAPRLAGVRY